MITVTSRRVAAIIVCAFGAAASAQTKSPRVDPNVRDSEVGSVDELVSPEAPAARVLQDLDLADSFVPVAANGMVFPGDTCATSTPITSFPFMSTWEFSFASPSARAGSCNEPGATQMRNDGWFTHTATFDGLLRVTSQGVMGAGQIQFMCVIYRGAACEALIEVACGVSAGNGESLVVEAPMAAGETYWIQSGRFGIGMGGGGGGGAGLNQTVVGLAPNDECAGAFEIVEGVPAFADTSFASTSPNDPPFACRELGAGQGAGSLWYFFIAESEAAGISTCNTAGPVSGADSLLAVYSGSCGALTQIACNDTGGCYPSSGLASLHVTGLTPGATYYVEVAASTPDAAREYRLDFVHAMPCPPGALIEPESCGTNVNGGCNTSPTEPPTTPIALDQSVCGLLYTEPCCGTGITRDLDWFEFEVTATTRVSCCISGQPEADLIAWIVTPTCPFVNESILAQADPARGDPACLDVTLKPGQYWLVVAIGNLNPFGVHPLACGEGNDYQFTLRTAPLCEGDANGDGTVNFEDINAVIANWLATYTPGTGPGDASNDSVVNFDDVNAVIANWLSSCP